MSFFHDAIGSSNVRSSHVARNGSIGLAGFHLPGLGAGRNHYPSREQRSPRRQEAVPGLAVDLGAWHHAVRSAPVSVIPDRRDVLVPVVKWCIDVTEPCRKPDYSLNTAFHHM